MTGILWLTKLLMSHLLTDFILQPKNWIDDRKQHHFRSTRLYLHGFVTALLAWVIVGWQYWAVALAILITHIVIDGWKSYQKETIRLFIADQLLHILVLIVCWYFTFADWLIIKSIFTRLNNNERIWPTITAMIFLTAPAGILIGQFTRQWREKIHDAAGLENAGKWIGITERLIVFMLVLLGQFSAIGLLVTAKGIIRFSEKDRQETKTEYLVIGTLLSIGIAILTGLITKYVANIPV